MPREDRKPDVATLERWEEDLGGQVGSFKRVESEIGQLAARLSKLEDNERLRTLSVKPAGSATAESPAEWFGETESDIDWLAIRLGRLEDKISATKPLLQMLRSGKETEEPLTPTERLAEVQDDIDWLAARVGQLEQNAPAQARGGPGGPTSRVICSGREPEAEEIGPAEGSKLGVQGPQPAASDSRPAWELFAKETAERALRMLEIRDKQDEDTRTLRADMDKMMEENRALRKEMAETRAEMKHGEWLHEEMTVMMKQMKGEVKAMRAVRTMTPVLGSPALEATSTSQTAADGPQSPGPAVDAVISETVQERIERVSELGRPYLSASQRRAWGGEIEEEAVAEGLTKAAMDRISGLEGAEDAEGDSVPSSLSKFQRPTTVQSIAPRDGIANDVTEKKQKSKKKQTKQANDTAACADAQAVSPVSDGQKDLVHDADNMDVFRDILTSTPPPTLSTTMDETLARPDTQILELIIQTGEQTSSDLLFRHNDFVKTLASSKADLQLAIDQGIAAVREAAEMGAASLEGERATIKERLETYHENHVARLQQESCGRMAAMERWCKTRSGQFEAETGRAKAEMKAEMKDEAARRWEEILVVSAEKSVKLADEATSARDGIEEVKREATAEIVGLVQELRRELAWKGDGLDEAMLRFEERMEGLYGTPRSFTDGRRAVESAEELGPEGVDERPA